ncbi:MAG: HD domain-containing protein [Woeseiaceae bacterium]|nr:HD domain-containing protein [Woeseiaceae bacterium]
MSSARPSPVRQPHQTPADQILDMLSALERLEDGRVEQGRALNQLDHALQTATRAERAGADEEVIVAALCHDVGKLFAWWKHGPIAAEILKPFVRPDVAWAVAVHEDFTTPVRKTGAVDRKRRRRHRLHPAYYLALALADDLDRPAIDPGYDTLPLDHFRPMVERVFIAPRYQRRRSFSLKYRIARTVLRAIRPIRGRPANVFEEEALEKTAALYRSTSKSTIARIASLKAILPRRKTRGPR